jgi:hypothetical protein
MTDPRVKLRNPLLAAALAWLIPGAGHLYQRRYFKAVVYSVCILTTFFMGCSLGEAKAVHLRWDSAAKGGESRQRTLGYLAQFGVGLPALPALIQYVRYEGQQEAEQKELVANTVLEDIDAEFQGILSHQKLGHATLTGRVTGQLLVGAYGYGTQFEGDLIATTDSGQTLELALRGSSSGGSMEIGPKIAGLDNVTVTELTIDENPIYFSAEERRFYCRVIDAADGYSDLGMIEGTVPRAFMDHFEAPLNDNALQYLHGKLGKFYELALVYTWIAGLLNVLAVWDALQGPAYGYGDEVAEEPTDSKQTKDGKKPEPADDPEVASATT